MRESLSPKQRVLTAFSHREPDRVPINYSANLGIDRRLKEHFGLDPSDTEGLYRALGVDFRGVSAPYRGAQLHPPAPDRQIDIWGMHYRWVEHGAGGYWDLCDFPLKEAGLDEVLAWRLPSPDDFDYSGVAESCRRYGEYAVVAGGAGISAVMNFTGRLRSMERMFIDLATDDEAGLCLIDRLIDVRYQWLRRTIEAAEDGFDILYMGEDLGTQRGPMISRRLFHKHILPRHHRFIELAKTHGLSVMFHACGSSSWTYDDYIAAGVDIFETLQPEAKDMSPVYLKSTFGDRLCFHGAISTTGPVSFGTPDDVVAEVRSTLAIMMPGGGYTLAPAHALQDNSPTENVLALYEAAHTYGIY